MQFRSGAEGWRKRRTVVWLLQCVEYYALLRERWRHGVRRGGWARVPEVVVDRTLWAVSWRCGGGRVQAAVVSAGTAGWLATRSLGGPETKGDWRAVCGSGERRCAGGSLLRLRSRGITVGSAERRISGGSFKASAA